MKKILSVLLSLIMVLSLYTPAFAADEQTAEIDYDGYPVVIVRGIDFMGLTKSDGSKAMKLRAIDIFDLILDVLVGTVIDKNEKALPEAIVDFVWDFMGPVANNPDGTSMDEDVSMVQYDSNMADHMEFYSQLRDKGENGVVRSVSETIDLENTYYFTYDWRKSPDLLAAELNELIETAKSQTKKNKVHIACCSMGGMVTTAYMYYYGHDSLDSVTYLSAANNGTYVCGDALNGDIHFTPETLTNTFNGMISGNFNVVMRVLMAFANGLGIMDMLCDFLNGFIEENTEYAYGDCLRDIFGTALGLWALCPDGQYRSGVEFIFTGYEEKYAPLLEKLDEVEEFVLSTEETTMAAYNDGVKISILSNYNKALTPVSDSAFLNGDGALETELTSSFATVAPFGETLSDEYIATRDAKYISPDKVIDASTCLLPDSTWFVSGAGHVASKIGSDYSDLILKLVLSQTQPKVYDFEYPQFLTADEELNLVANF